MFDLDDLRSFIEVAETGGVTQAAQRLGLSKSIVSRRLVRLEEGLGAQLLARSTRGASLTEAGATFREHAMRVIVELENAQDALSPEGDVRGLLRLAAPLTFGATQLAPVLAELANRHPELQIHTTYGDRFVDLIGGGFDASIRVGYLADSSLVAKRVAPVRGALVASPAYLDARGEPKQPADLMDHECLMQGTEPWRLTDKGKTITVHPHGRFKADNGTALAAAAVAGLGIALLPEFETCEHVATGALKAVLTDYAPPDAAIYVLRPPGDAVPRKTRALIDIMIETFGGATAICPAGP